MRSFRANEIPRSEEAAHVLIAFNAGKFWPNFTTEVRRSRDLDFRGDASN